MQQVAPAIVEAAITGAVDLRHEPDGVVPLRLPGTARRDFPFDGIDWVTTDAAGVRLRLLTGARHLVLTATFTRNRARVGTAWPITLVALIGGDGAPRTVELWLPHTAQVLLHTLSADAPVEAPPAAAIPRWTHHGSSISHGLDTDGPLGPWPVQAAHDLGLDLLHLGFAGNAMLDPFTARAIAGQPADVITLKLGINTINGDSMTERTFVPALHNFLDLVRDGHPQTPIALITAVSCPMHEDVAGPTVPGADGKHAAGGTGTLTLGRTRQLLADAAARRDDDALWVADGLQLFGPGDASHLYDNLHPDQAGHDLMAGRFAALVRSGEGPLAAAFASVLP